MTTPIWAKKTAAYLTNLLTVTPDCRKDGGDRRFLNHSKEYELSEVHGGMRMDLKTPAARTKPDRLHLSLLHHKCLAIRVL